MPVTGVELPVAGVELPTADVELPAADVELAAGFVSALTDELIQIKATRATLSFNYILYFR